MAVDLDSILVSGVDEADHLRNLDTVLTRLEEVVLHLRRSIYTYHKPLISLLLKKSPFHKWGPPEFKDGQYT